MYFCLFPKHWFTTNFCCLFSRKATFQAFFVVQISKTLVYKHFQNLSSIKKKSGLKNQKRAIHKLQKCKNVACGQPHNVKGASISLKEKRAIHQLQKREKAKKRKKNLGEKYKKGAIHKLQKRKILLMDSPIRQKGHP